MRNEPHGSWAGGAVSMSPMTAVSDLAEFARAIREVIGAPAEVRPFVCEGSPLACRVVLAGSTPARGAGMDFWRWWDDAYGFRKAEWLPAYAGVRPPSTTRRITERILAAAAPVAVLETNVVPVLPEGPTAAGLFELLLALVRPPVLVLHGRGAAEWLRDSTGLAGAPDRFTPVRMSWGQVHVLAVRHLGRGWSYERADALGAAIREAAPVPAGD